MNSSRGIPVEPNRPQLKPESRYQLKQTQGYIGKTKCCANFSRTNSQWASQSYNLRFTITRQQLIRFLLFATAVMAVVPFMRQTPVTYRPVWDNTRNDVMNNAININNYTNMTYSADMQFSRYNETISRDVEMPKIISSPITPITKLHNSFFNNTNIFYLFNSTDKQKRYNSSVEQFIQDQTIIRVYAVKVGGFGHLSGTQTLMRKIRQQFGFQGTFEIIYPHVDRKSVAIIFNLPSTLPDVYDDVNNNYRFIKLEEQIRRFKNNEIRPVALGLSGATDSDDVTCWWAGIYSSAQLNDTEKTMCRNVANLLNVSVYASITRDPHAKGSSFQLGDQVFLRNNDKRYCINETGTFFTAPLVPLEQAKNFLRKNPTLGIEIPALNVFIEGIENKNYFVLPIYGRSLQQDLGDSSTHFLDNLFQILIGARYAQLSCDSRFSCEKPLVIAYFGEYQAEFKIVKELISRDNWGIYEKSWGKNIRNAIAEVNLNSEVCTTASLSNIKTINVINALRSNQILLLSVGSLPQIIFESIFAHTADNMWPPVREGFGTLSNLMMTGAPHFYCQVRDSTWDIGFDLIKDSFLLARLKKFYDLIDGFCGKNTWEVNSQFYKEFGHLILESRLADSAFSKYFRDLKTIASEPKHDRVHDILSKILKFLNGDRQTLGNSTIDLPDWPEQRDMHVP